MSTRKKKTEIESQKKVWPKITVGSHLTVITYENGKTELVWDDAALLKEVKDAILAYELENKKPAVKAKLIRRKKSENV